MSIWDDAPKNSEAVYKILKEMADDMRTATYGEIAATIGLREERRAPAAQSIGNPLGFIRDRICRERGLPWLNALAVSADTRRPGDSFLPYESGSLGSTDELDVWWRGAVLAVFAYPWDRVDLM